MVKAKADKLGEKRNRSTHTIETKTEQMEKDSKTETDSQIQEQTSGLPEGSGWGEW